MVALLLTVNQALRRKHPVKIGGAGVLGAGLMGVVGLRDL